MKKISVASLITLLSLLTSSALASNVGLLGVQALRWTEKIVAFGPRPSASDALEKVRGLVEKTFAEFGMQVKREEFVANTPRGKIAMTNLIAMQQGQSANILVLACHLESKWMPQIHFVGANDSAAPCGLLLALAEHWRQKKFKHHIWFLFTDGEESFGPWSAQDSLYGSRHMAKVWQEAGLIANLQAFILLDMIGDKDLQVIREARADATLVEKVTRLAAARGWQKHFFASHSAIEDDHLPFALLGVPTLNLIDLTYGPLSDKHPTGAYHHTALDTLDKVSAHSLQIIGETVAALVADIDISAAAR